MAFKFQLGAARMSGSLTQEEGITVDSGGLTVTAGGATVTAGGLTVAAGTSAVQALTATTLSGSGAISTLSTLACDGAATLNAGLTVSAGTSAVQALTATTLSGSGAISTLSTLACDGAATLNAGLTVSAGTTAMQAATCTSLSAGDGNITNVGSIACDTVTVDDATAGLDVSFGGNTGTNAISLQDNLADALNIKQAGNSYMKFTTTDSSELITFGKGLTAASQTWTDLGAVTTCDINGGTIDGTSIGASTAAAVTGTIITAKTSVRPDTLGGADLGEDGIGWGDVYIADDKKIKFGNGNDATIEYDEDGTDELRFAGAAVTFEQAVTFDDAVTLGESTADSITVLGNSTFENTTIADLGTVTTCDINGGAMDGVTVGANTPENGTFSTLVGSTVESQGALTVAGLTTLNGSTDVGDAVGDTCTFTARIDSDIVPSTDSARNLGTTGLRWSTIYVDSIVGANVAWDVESRAAGQTISADTDFCLVTSANGGTVTMPAASAGKVVRVKLSASVGDLVLSAGTDDTIESSGSIRLESTGSAVILVSYDATNWFVM
jgi:hypothetical protein